jgi:AraC family transcriptional regulator of adaptative response / DNA-3-methyladenine glycosylase II
MLDQHAVYYTAMKSRDTRFDGRFFIGVHTTGIYCRPVCPAPCPKPENVTFYPTAAAAKKAGFRPCLRCRPESSPGTPEWDAASTSIAQALRLIAEGYLNKNSVDDLAEELYLSTRQLRRLFEEHVGASPIDVAQTQRLHFAKQLITETNLGMAETAFTAGFSSVRRFNAVIQKTYGRSPLALRNGKRGARGLVEDGSLRLRLAFRPPYDWDGIVAFMAGRAIPGVERVTQKYYRRAARRGDASGVIEVSPVVGKNMVELRVSPGLTKELTTIVERVKRMFDLKAYPDEIAEHLGKLAIFNEAVNSNPGLRLPGAWDGFEVTVRAILGQQVSVKAANTLAGRLVDCYGEKLAEPNGSGLTHLFPRADVLAEADLEGIGLTGQRIKAIRAVARAVESGELRFGAFASMDETVEILQTLPGVGTWTAEYVAMRALGEPDAFPAGDLGLRKAMSNGKGLISAAKLRKRAEAWRPWRAYAAMYLWASLADEREEESDGL